MFGFLAFPDERDWDSEGHPIRIPNHWAPNHRFAITHLKFNGSPLTSDQNPKGKEALLSEPKC